MDREVLVVSAPRSNAILVIVIDALPWELVRATGFLDDLASFRGPLKTVLGYSAAALPTLFSGEMPAKHGHWTMYRHDASGSPFKTYGPLLSLARIMGREGWVRRFIERALPISASIKGYFKLYDVPLELLTHYSLVERNDIFSPGGLGKTLSLFDILEQRGVSYKVWTWRSSEEANVRDAMKEVENRSASFFFLYTPELDAVMHANGVFSEQARLKLREQENWVRDIYGAARSRYKNVSLLICSDHGMTDVTEGHDLMGYVKSRVPLHVPADYVAFYDSTMARFWGNTSGALDQIREVLASVDYGVVLSSKDLEGLGLNFNHKAFGEIVFLLEPGHVILPSYMGKELPAAMHGYHPDDRFSFGAWASDSPIDPQPTHIKDVLRAVLEAVDGLGRPTA